jgi:hypothetical protein
LPVVQILEAAGNKVATIDEILVMLA